MLYAQVGEALRAVFGAERAGWAFMTIFVGEVHPFRLRLRATASTGGGKDVAAAEKANLLQHQASAHFEQSAYFLY